MPARKAEAYWIAMTPIQAEEVMIQARIASHPHTVKEDQRAWLDALSQDRRKFLGETKALSMKEFVEVINGRKAHS